MERFGIGSWKKILETFRFHEKRTAVDLKDKWRNVFGSCFLGVSSTLLIARIGSANEKARRSTRDDDEHEDIEDSF